MPASDINISQLRLDAPVYCQKGDLVGHLRFVLAEEEPPYMVQSIVLDRGNQGASVTVPVSAISEIVNGKIQLSIANEALPELPEYISSRSNNREYRESNGWNKRNHSNMRRQSSGRRSYSSRRNQQDR